MATRADKTISRTALLSNPRAEKRYWDRYAAHIQRAYERHPTPYSFSPAQPSPATVCSHLRDVIKGGIAFEHVDFCTPTELESWYNSIIIRADHESVHIGPPMKGTLPEVETLPDASRFEFAELTWNEILAFMTLLSSGRIQGPVKIRKLGAYYYSLIEQRAIGLPNLQILPRDGGVILL